MAETHCPRSDFFVGIPVKTILEEELMEYDEANQTNPVKLPLGTILQLQNERFPRVVGLTDTEGNVTGAYAVKGPTTDTLKRVRRDTALIDLLTGGSPDKASIVSIRRNRFTQEQFMDAVNRGNKQYIKDEALASELVKVLTTPPNSEAWQKSHSSRRRGRKTT